MPSRGLLLSLAAAACLPLTGCGSAAPPAAARYRIAVIPKGLTHAHWQSVHRGAERAAADLTALGIPTEILWDGPTRESDIQEQISLVRVKCGLGIHGLVLAPQHSKLMVPPVREAVRRGIPVVIIDSNLDRDELKADPTLMIKYVATDNYNGGRLAAEHLLKTLAAEGKAAPRLVLFRYQVGSESTEQREQGFLDVVKAVIEKQKAAGQPAPELVDTNTYAEATVDSAQRAAGPMLTRLRDNLPDGIFAVNESATTGLLNALRSQGLAKKVRVMGFDASEPLIQAVRSGDVVGTIVQDPYRMGYLAVWVAVRHGEGDDVSAGGLTLGTGEVVVTRDNLDSDEVRGLFDPEVQKARVITPPTFPKK